MEKIKLVIKNITEIRKSLTKASKTKASSLQRCQEDHFSTAQRKLSELKHLLGQEDVRISVDKALIEIHQNNEQFNKNQNAQILVSNPSKEFLDFEMRLYENLGIKRKELEQLLTQAKRYLLENKHDESQLSSRFFPSDSSELLSIIELQVKTSIDEIQKGKSLPRKTKRERKSKALSRFWLGTVGTGLALGDVALALPSIGLTAPVAIASIATGVVSLGAAVFDDPNVFQHLPGKQNDDSGDCEA